MAKDEGAKRAEPKGKPLFEAPERLRIQKILEELYPGRALELEGAIEALVTKRGRGREGGGFNPFFAASDAIFITYPDMLEGEGEAPLARLSRFAEVRVSGLFSHVHILPFFPSSSDEGFSVMDHRAVDPRLGGWDEVEKIGSRFGLVVDLVLNHASARGVWFREFLGGRPPYDRYFVTRPVGYDSSAVFRPRTDPLFTRFHREDGSDVEVWTTFSADQVDLDYSEPAVLLEMLDVILGYAARGARVVRLDAVAYIWKEDGTDCVDRPQAHAIVRLLRTVLDAAAPGLTLLAETNLPHEVNVSYFGGAGMSGADEGSARGVAETGGGAAAGSRRLEEPEAGLVYNFALPPLLLHAFVMEDAGPVASWASHLPEPRPDRAFVNFLASHDGIGVTPARDLLPPGSIDALASAVRRRGGLVSERTTPTGPVPYELNTTFLDAIAEPSAGEAERLRAFLSAHAALFALAGLPAVYFHSLVGSRNWVDGPRVTGSKRSICRARLDFASLCAELDDPASLRSCVFRGLSALLAARAARQSFAPWAPQRVLSPDGSGELLSSPESAGERLGGPLFALLRGGAGGAVIAAVNVSGHVARCAIPAGFDPSGHPFDPSGLADFEAGTGELVVPPLGTLWIDGRMKGS